MICIDRTCARHKSRGEHDEEWSFGQSNTGMEMEGDVLSEMAAFQCYRTELFHPLPSECTT